MQAVVHVLLLSPLRASTSIHCSNDGIAKRLFRTFVVLAPLLHQIDHIYELNGNFCCVTCQSTTFLFNFEVFSLINEKIYVFQQMIVISFKPKCGKCRTKAMMVAAKALGKTSIYFFSFIIFSQPFRLIFSIKPCFQLASMM